MSILGTFCSAQFSSSQSELAYSEVNYASHALQSSWAVSIAQCEIVEEILHITFALLIDFAKKEESHSVGFQNGI